MSQHVTSFPRKDLKISPFACHSISFIDLTCHGLVMTCHCMSRVVTACHGISCDKGGVTHQRT
jgi:hypothetical protein